MGAQVAVRPLPRVDVDALPVKGHLSRSRRSILERTHDKLLERARAILERRPELEHYFDE
jgi:hypothetical protein